MATALLELPSTENFPRKRLTRQEYYSLIEEGFFDEGPRVELIDGVIVPMSPELQPHVKSMIKLTRLLNRMDGNGRHVRINSALSIGPDVRPSEPQPDGAVYTGSEDDYEGNPTTALLVVEVSGTSLRRDRTLKASLYALANVQEYWLLDVGRCVLEVRRDPAPMPDQPHGAGYRSVQTYRPGDTLYALAAPDVEVVVGELFAAQR